MKKIVVFLVGILFSFWILTRTVSSEQKGSTIAELITEQAQEAVAAGVAEDTGSVTVRGRVYFILVLKNRIDPIACEVLPNSGPAKVYVDTENYPISDIDNVHQKIGLIDFARTWQQGIGSPGNLAEKLTQLNERWKIYAEIEYGDAIAKAIPTGLVGALVRSVVEIIKEEVSDPMTELRDNVADNGFSESFNNYLEARKIARNRIEDYDVARKYLEHYWKAEAYERAVFSLLDEINEVHKSKMDRIGEYLLKKLPTLVEELAHVFPLTEFVELVHEGKKAMDLEWKYSDMKDTELQQIQEKLSKLYEAAEYTLELSWCFEKSKREPVPPPPAAEPNKLTAFAKDRDEKPVKNAAVWLVNPRTYREHGYSKTNQAGYFKIDIAHTSEGNYVLYIIVGKDTDHWYALKRRDLYEPHKREISITKKAKEEGIFLGVVTLQKWYTITVQIMTESGSPYRDRVFGVYEPGSSTPSSQGSTDEDGRLETSPLPKGAYILKIWARPTGGKLIEREVNISGNDVDLGKIVIPKEK